MIVMSAPCMPKECYHFGNAISVIYADVLAKYLEYIDSNPVKIARLWNLHGFPYEKLFYEKRGYNGNYNEIFQFAEENKKNAMKEVSLFMQGDSIIDYSDTDEDFCDYTRETFLELIYNGFICEKNNIWYFDTSRMINQNLVEKVFEDICVSPGYLKKAIINQKNTFDSFYPLSKEREFTVSCMHDGKPIKINPIFQSFVYPLYLAKKNNQEKVDYLVCGSGFSMLKWNYYRQLVCYALKGDYSIKNLVFHGTILGEDGKPMSKHSNNCIMPSDICLDDDLFLRYCLIRSISTNDIPVFLEKYRIEFMKIEPKLRKSIFNDNYGPINNQYSKIIDDIFYYLEKLKFGVALESYYVYLRKVEMSNTPDRETMIKVKTLNRIFFGESKKGKDTY